MTSRRSASARASRPPLSSGTSSSAQSGQGRSRNPGDARLTGRPARRVVGIFRTACVHRVQAPWRCINSRVGTLVDRLHPGHWASSLAKPKAHPGRFNWRGWSKTLLDAGEHQGRLRATVGEAHRHGDRRTPRRASAPALRPSRRRCRSISPLATAFRSTGTKGCVPRMGAAEKIRLNPLEQALGWN
jgi:hypothetical protein